MFPNRRSKWREARNYTCAFQNITMCPECELSKYTRHPFQENVSYLIRALEESFFASPCLHVSRALQFCVLRRSVELELHWLFCRGGDNSMVMIGPAGLRGCISLNTFDCCQLLDCEPGFSFAACLNLSRSKIHQACIFKIYLKISHLIFLLNVFECLWKCSFNESCFWMLFLKVEILSSLSNDSKV